MAAALLHGDSVSSSRLDVSGREIRVAFTFSLDDVATLARLDLDRDGMVSREEWAKVLPLLLSYVGEHFQIDSDGERCLAVGDATRVPPPMPLQEGRSPVPVEVCYRGNLRHVAELSGGTVFIFDRDRTDSEGAGVQRRTGALGWSRGGILAAAIGALGLSWIRRHGGRRLSLSRRSAEPSPS
jgi:hypothetical protein